MSTVTAGSGSCSAPGRLSASGPERAAGVLHSAGWIRLIAQKHGGASEADNLALSCFCYYNSFKGPTIAGFHPASGRVFRLYHPRKDRWERHFRWNGPVLEGRTAIGDVTVAVLSINHPDAVAVREALLEEGVFPPPRRSKR